MIYAATLTCLLLISQIDSGLSSCNACIDGQCYRRVPLIHNFKTNGQLAVDRENTMLYFQMEDTATRRTTCAYDLDNVHLHIFPDFDFTFARAVDSATRDVYIADTERVYKTNPSSNFTEIYLLFHKSIWQMQFKDILFYTVFNDNGLMKYENSQHKEVEGLSQYRIDDFVVDKLNDIYFLSGDSLYRLKHGTQEASKFADDFYYISTDAKGEAYFIQPQIKTIHKVDYNTGEMKNIGLFGSDNMAHYVMVYTRNNNILYIDLDLDILYYLIRSDTMCKVETTYYIREQTSQKG